MNKVGNIFIYFVFFVLGAILYFVFPRDINVADARELIQTNAHFIGISDHNGYICLESNHPEADNCDQ